MKRRSTFFLGLFFVLPVAGVIWAVTWIVNVGQGFAPAIRPFVPFVPQQVSSGWENALSILLGLVILAVACGLIYLVGVLLERKLAASFLKWARDLLAYVPVVGKLYTISRDVVDNIPEDPQKAFGEPVLVRYPGTHVLVIGFKTSETKQRIGVVFPGMPPCLPYFFKKSDVQKIPNVSIEEALRAVVSSGMSLPPDVIDAVDTAFPEDEAAVA